MARSINKLPLPRFAPGVVTGEALTNYLDLVFREMIARFDPRNPDSDFPDGLLADPDDGSVTLGTEAYPSGRTSPVPTLVQKIDDDGRAADQKFMWPITVANRNSVQSISTVLSATSDDSTSTLEISAHSVKFDFGSVAYGSGTITGLDAETLYFCYTDDPDLEGGAVTYELTENPDNLIAKGRYYVGYIVTPPLGTTSTITAASSANPIVLTTSSAHGWATGDYVTFSSMPGDFAVLNGNTYEIIVTSATGFSVSVDGSLFGAYTSGGDAVRETYENTSGGGAGGGVGGSRWDYTVVLP